MKSGRVKYFIAAISSAVIWGFVFIPLRNLREFSAEQILYYRIITSFIITWIITLLLRRQKVRSDIDYIRAQSGKQRNQLLVLTVVGGILITGNWFSFIYAVNSVSLKSAAFAYMICPLITALSGFLILKEQLSKVKILAIGIAFISILILAKGSAFEVMWSVFIASFYAFHLIIQRVIRHIDKFNMLSVQLAIATILMLPLFIYQFNGIPHQAYFWLNILVIAVVFTIVPLFLSMYSLIGISSSTSGIIIYINPIISFAVAFFYFGERVGSLQLFAYSLLLVAVIVFNLAFIKEFFNKSSDQVQA
ncbi:MAG TPA: EamA family transporter [Sphingobacteriaceae bacterium]